MPFATNGAVRIAYSDAGPGPPLLLVHGLAYCREGWGPASPVPPETHRVIAFDNRGVGDSDAPRGPYTIPSPTDGAVRPASARGSPRRRRARGSAWSAGPARSSRRRSSCTAQTTA